MAFSTPPPQAIRQSPIFRGTNQLNHAQVLVRNESPNRIIRYVFIAFVFSLLFEAADIGIASTPSKLIGLLLTAVALRQRRLCYKFPPKAFWWFSLYIVGYVLHGAYLVLTRPDLPALASGIFLPVFTLIQLLILFWISYNLMEHEQIVKGSLWALATSAVLLVILQFAGITSSVSGGRVTALEQNPNSVASALSLGLLALASLAFGREERDRKASLLFYFTFAIVAIAIVQTGGRGAIVALTASLLLLGLKGKSLATKLKLGLIALVAVAVVGIASYQIDAVRQRWEMTLEKGSMSGREILWVVALEMIKERPLLGWGPVYNNWELGSRLGALSRDAHNMYLRLLAEGGIVGAFPFFFGLWLCWRAAWRARHGKQGMTPLIMLLFILVRGLSSGPLFGKLFWVILSYALASGSYIPVSRSRQAAVSSQYTPSPVGFRLRPPKPSRRPVRKVFGVPRHS